MTAPLSSPLSCTVLVDGARVADGADTDDPLSPTALSGLTVTWGRDTTLDQPAAASCTVDVLDRTGGAAFPGALATGRTLDVRTATEIYPDPTIPTVTDPGFDAGGPGRVPRNATVSVTAGAATLRAVDTTRPGVVIFAPGVFAAPGTSPDAWDGIPRTAAGQTWRVGATVTVPAWGAAATVYPAAFTGPWADTATVLSTHPVPVSSPGGAVAVSFLPPPGVWLGVAVQVWPNGWAWDQVPPALTWDTVPAGITWDGLGTVTIDDLLVLAPAAGVKRDALVFSGRITDLSAQWDQARDATLIQVTAQDHTAELSNRDTGAEPWAVETLGARAARIVAASGQGTALTVDPGVAGVSVSRMDVDNQPCLTLLQDLAGTCDGVLWSAVHTLTGQYLWLEDTGARPPLMTLTLDPDNVIRVHPDPGAPHATTLSACDVLMDPLRWVQDVADVATRVAVRWLEQVTDTQGKPATVDRTEQVQDAALVTALGVRRIGVSTLHVSAAAAAVVGQKIIARTNDRGWRVNGITWSTGLEALDAARVSTAFDLLDGTTRLARPLVLTDLPAWIDPNGTDTVPLYLEGGVYDYTDGAWTLAMYTSSARAQGNGPAWDELDAAWTWDQFDPAITWNALGGVSA